MSSRRDRGRWAGVDWSQSNRVIAGRLGVDPESVRYQRRKRGAPSARAAAVAAFRAFVAARRDELHGVEVAAAVRLAGVALDVDAARRILRAAGVGTYRHPGGATVPSGFPAVNWDLPNPTLARVWNLNHQVVRNERSRRKAPRAKWDVRSTSDMMDEAFLAAVEREGEQAGGILNERNALPE